MTTKEYIVFHEDFCRKMIEVTQRKNNDYAGHGNDDPFANFRIVENINIASAEVGFLTRMTDKLSRITTFVHKGDLLVKDESVEDTLLDLANYSALLAGYIRDKKMRLQPQPTYDASSVPVTAVEAKVEANYDQGL